MKRLFFAVELSRSVREQLQRLREAIDDRLEGGVRVRWTAPDHLHLTLKFLGTLEDGLVPRLADVADEQLAEVEPFETTVRDIGAFPNPAHPRILWAGVDRESQSRLVELHGAFEQALAPLGVEPDEHAFTAHVTVGRVKSNRTPALTDWRGELPGGPFGTIPVDEIVLYESELDDSGPEYTVLHRSSFGRGAA